MKLKLPKFTMWWLVAAGVVVVILLSVGKKDSNADDNATSDCRFSVTADALNVRSGPGADESVVGQLEKGKKTNAQAVVENGFRKLGDKRWVSSQFLAAEPQNTCP